jgi:hypothetical protein
MSSYTSSDLMASPSLLRGVAVQVGFRRAKFVTGFSRWVKGQAQGLEPGGFKLWVNVAFTTCTAPHRGVVRPSLLSSSPENSFTAL